MTSRAAINKPEHGVDEDGEPGREPHESLEPQIEIRLPKGTSHRLVSAALHKLAADVELATPERERWIVQTESFYDARGRVYLELADATPAEHRPSGGWRC